MKHIKSIIPLLIVIFSSNYSQAQTDTLNQTIDTAYQLTEQDIKDCEQAALDALGLFEGYLKVLTSKNAGKTQLDNARHSALKLFINEYATMQTSSKKTGTISTQTIKSYLNKISGLPYSKIEIEFYSYYISTNLTKVEGSNLYSGTATYYQTFKGCNIEGGCRSDVTAKKIEFYVEIIPIYVGEEKKYIFSVLLGDIDVIETR